jgi:hypothetical protein
MLKTYDKGVEIHSISKLLTFDPHGPLPKNYKLNYGIRFSGIHEALVNLFFMVLIYFIKSQVVD